MPIATLLCSARPSVVFLRVSTLSHALTKQKCGKDCIINLAVVLAAAGELCCGRLRDRSRCSRRFNVSSLRVLIASRPFLLPLISFG